MSTLYTNFEIEKGELVIIVGPSGAGKTTTLNILGGMDSPTRGKVIIDDKDISHCNNSDTQCSISTNGR